MYGGEMKLLALATAFLVIGCSNADDPGGSNETSEPKVLAGAVIGFDSIIPTNLFVRVTTDEEWRELYFRHRPPDKLQDKPTPALDFGKEMLVGIYYQVATNSSGISFHSAFEDTNTVEVRFREYSNFTTRIENGYRPYIHAWMKKSTKPIKIFKSVSGTEFSDKEQWEIVAEIGPDD